MEKLFFTMSLVIFLSMTLMPLTFHNLKMVPFSFLHIFLSFHLREMSHFNILMKNLLVSSLLKFQSLHFAVYGKNRYSSLFKILITLEANILKNFAVIMILVNVLISFMSHLLKSFSLFDHSQILYRLLFVYKMYSFSSESGECLYLIFLV